MAGGEGGAIAMTLETAGSAEAETGGMGNFAEAIWHVQPGPSDLSAESDWLGGSSTFLAQQACPSLGLGAAGLDAGAAMAQPWPQKPAAQSMAESAWPDAPQIKRTANVSRTTGLDARFRICLIITPAEGVGFPRFCGSMPNFASCLRLPYLLP